RHEEAPAPAVARPTSSSPGTKERPMDTQTKADKHPPYTTLPNLVDPTADKGIFEANYVISWDMVDDADLEGARHRRYNRPCNEPPFRSTPVMDLEFDAPLTIFSALLAKELRPE